MAVVVVCSSTLLGSGTLHHEVLVFSLAIGANITDVNVTDPSTLAFLDPACQGGPSHHEIPRFGQASAPNESLNAAFAHHVVQIEGYHGIIIDAGSSGSRAWVFAWPAQKCDFNAPFPAT